MKKRSERINERVPVYEQKVIRLRHKVDISINISLALFGQPAEPVNSAGPQECAFRRVGRSLMAKGPC